MLDQSDRMMDQWFLRILFFAVSFRTIYNRLQKRKFISRVCFGRRDSYVFHEYVVIYILGIFYQNIPMAGEIIQSMSVDLS